MGRDLGLDGVVDHFTLSGDEAGWLRNKSGATRLGFAVQLMFLTWRGRFPKMRLELPPDAVEHVAKQVGVAASELGFYDFTSRVAKRHRSELRDLTGWHECSKTDLVKLVSHLVDVIWHDERREEQVRAELLRQVRADLIEPPTAAQIATIIRSALHQADDRAVAEVAARLAREEDCPRRLDALVFTDPTATASRTTTPRPWTATVRTKTWSRCSPTSSPIRATSASTHCWTRSPNSSRSEPSAPKRVMRTVYEACVFQALRDRLRCKEIWVVGADKWRNPDDDLPDDFEVRRAEYYEKLNKPREATVFTARLQAEMRAELGALDTSLSKLPWVTISGKHRNGAIKFTEPEPQKEPKNLRKLKKAIRKKWGTVAVIDILKEAALRTGMLKALAPVGTREAIDEAKLLERLLLIAYAYGTNSGISSVASGEHKHTEEELRYTARRYLTAVGLKAAGVEIANATFAARSEAVWGQGTTTVASDSTHFKAWDRNIFTEWHSRYGGRGVLVYWPSKRVRWPFTASF